MAVHAKESGIKKQQAGKNIISRTRLAYIFLGVIFIIAIYYLVSSPSENKYPATPVHWHARPVIKICGEAAGLPQNKGIHQLHTHTDGLIHIEDMVRRDEDIMLGRAFDMLGILFTNQSIYNYSNGDLCDGTPAALKMFVNGVQNYDFRNYVLKDGDEILIEFS